MQKLTIEQLRAMILKALKMHKFEVAARLRQTENRMTGYKPPVYSAKYYEPPKGVRIDAAAFNELNFVSPNYFPKLVKKFASNK